MTGGISHEAGSRNAHRPGAPRVSSACHGVDSDQLRRQHVDADTAAIDHGLHRGAQFLGVLASIQGAGAIVGVLSAATVIRRFSERSTIAAGLALLALGVASTATNSLALICAAIAGGGVGIVWAVVAAITLRQRLTPPTLQGRVAAAASMYMNLPQTTATVAAAAPIVVVDYRVMIATTALAILTAATAARLTADPGRTAHPVRQQDITESPTPAPTPISPTT